MKSKWKVFCVIAFFLFAGSLAAQSVAIEGTLKRWHKVTLKLTGPSASESDSNNPFMNYRFNVTFSHPASGTTYVIPGYFAADGDAGNSSASSGNKWKAHLSPDHTGNWNYTISFRQGSNVAVGGTNAGSALSPYNGVSGSFTITESDKSGRDFRAKENGRLKYVGQRYLKFSGSNRYFLKQGADAPENLLAYQDFDGNFKSDGQKDNLVKTWSAHVGDWNSGDPTFKNGKGKGLIGAINYLAAEGMNVFSFLTMNIGGDDRNVFPYTDYNERYRMDCSKLDQWEVIFEHGDKLGMYLHFKTQETENDQLLDGGNLGNERKLYYRELIARYSHHLALNWNLGEETTNTTSQLQSFAQYFYDNDPYRHNVVLHSYPGQYDQRYGPLLGSASKLTGLSIQTSNASFGQEHKVVLDWVNKSNNAGRPWVVAVDEPGDAQHAIRPDNDAGNSHEDGRKKALWGTFMAGGAGNEWYFGYGHAHSDLTCQDFRSRDQWWDYCRHALSFFNDNNVPFNEMISRNDLIGNSSDDNSAYCFAKAGTDYVIYLPSGGTKNINLNGVNGTFKVKWFDPRNGGNLKDGSVNSIQGGGSRSVGNPPNNVTKDWVIYLSSDDTNPNPSLSLDSLTLINADTDQPIAAFDPIPQNATINLYTLPTKNISIRANATAAGSVRFGVDSNSNVQTESALPYAIAGDTNGDYNAWNIGLGAHTVTATAFSGSSATGTASATFTRNITIIDEAPPQLAVTKLNLIDASSDTVVKQLTNGTVINKSTLPSFSVQAVTSGTIGSVIFELNGAVVQTENQPVYSVSGNSGNDYNDWPISAGSYTLKATPYSGSNGSGEAGQAVTVNFSVVLNSLPNGQTSSNVGNTAFSTLVTHNNGSYLISASGADIWGTADAFGFVHQDSSGDIEVTAQVESIENTNSWAKAGVMIRETLDANSKHAMTVVTPAQGASFQRRTATGATSGHTTFKGITAPEYVRVLRTGNKFTGYFSSDNTIWYPMNSVIIGMASAVKVGMAVTSHNNSAETEALISNFTVRNPAGNLAVTHFVLVNSDTNQDIREIHHNETINLTTDGTNLSIRAEANGIEGSVVFNVDGSKFQTESASPYAIAGDSSGNYKPWTPSVGSHTIMATPYSEAGGNGSPGTSLAIVINVVQ